MHVLGWTRRGKSKFIEWLIRNDVRNRDGLCLIDPHGSLYTDIVRWCVRTGALEKRDIVLLEPSNSDWTFGFNPLDFEGFSAQARSNAVEAMVKIVAQVQGGEDLRTMPRLSRCMPTVFHAIAEKRLTLREALDLCDSTDQRYRESLTRNLSDDLFAQEWAELNGKSQTEFQGEIESTRNRIFGFLRDLNIRRMVSQTEHTLDVARAMDTGGIVLINLAGLTDLNKRILGALFVNSLFQKALHREPNKSRPFYLYLDECYYFFNDDISRIITECAKFGLHLILAHQYLGQLREAGNAVYSAVMGIENKVVFGGISPAADASLIAQELFRFDPNKPKRVLDKPIVTGHIREWLQNHSESTGTSHTGSDSSSRTESQTEGREEAVGTISTTTQSSESVALSRTWSQGESQSLVPLYEWMHTATVPLSDQIYMAMDTMVNQPAQRAVVKLAGRKALHVKTPTVSESIVNDGRIQTFKERAFKGSGIATPTAEAEEQIRRRRRILREKSGTLEPDSFLE